MRSLPHGTLVRITSPKGETYHARYVRPEKNGWHSIRRIYTEHTTRVRWAAITAIPDEDDATAVLRDLMRQRKEET